MLYNTTDSMEKLSQMPQLHQNQQEQQLHQQEMTFTSSTVTSTARRRDDNDNGNGNDNDYGKDVILKHVSTTTTTATNDATMEVRDLSNERITSMSGVLLRGETEVGTCTVKGMKTNPFSATTSTVDKYDNKIGSNVRIEQQQDDNRKNESSSSLSLSRNSSFPRNQMTPKTKFNNNDSIDFDIMSLLLNPSVSTSGCSNSNTSNTSILLNTSNPVQVTTIQSSLQKNNTNNDININNNNANSELKLYHLVQNSNENEHIIGEDALVAAITDIRTLQQKLFDAENQIVQLQKQQISSHSSTEHIERRKHNDLTAAGSDNSSSSGVDSTIISLVGENNDEESATVNTTTQNGGNEDVTTLKNDIDITKEMEQLRIVNNELSTKNCKLTTNMKKKREIIESNVKKLKTVTDTVNELQKERGVLLQNISKLTCGRDELKIKLVCKNEISREQKLTVDRLERRYKSLQTIRAKELQLLDLYRQLSVHTGYFKWGKQIRVIENELSDIQQQQSQANDDYADSY